MKILSALEALEPATGQKTVPEVPMDDLLMDVYESECAITTAIEELDELDSIVTDAEASIEELEHIKASIEQFGISKSMMVMADATGELPAAGIVPDYESLSDVPTGTPAVEAVEARDAIEAVEGVEAVEAKDAVEACEAVPAIEAAFGVEAKDAIEAIAAQPAVEAVEGVKAIAAQPAIEAVEGVDAVYDAETIAAIEGITGTLEGIFGKIAGFFSKIGASVSNFFKTMMRGFKSYEAALKGLIAKIDGITVDTEKLAGLKAKVYSADDVKKMATAYGVITKGTDIKNTIAALESISTAVNTLTAENNDKLSAAMNAAESKIAGKLSALAGNEDVVAASGIKVMASEGKISSVSIGKITIKRTGGTMSDHGWSEGSIKDGINGTISTIQDAIKMGADLEMLAKEYKTLGADAKKNIKSVLKGEKSSIKLANSAIALQKRLIGYQRAICQAELRMVQAMAGGMLVAGKAVLKAKAKA